MSPLRTVFLGTADLACCSLQALVQAPNIEVVGVVSQPDKAKGRKLVKVPTPVKAEALRHDLPVWQPEKLRADAELIARLKQLELDVIVVAAYGQLLPSSVLSAPRRGCVNVHTSLLPKYRGAAPIQWAILNGDQETGVTIMQMEQGLDTGPIISQRTTPIEPDDTGGSLHDRLASLGAELLVATLPEFVSAKTQPIPQNEDEATHARKLRKEDSIIDWSRSATAIRNQIRGLNPWPGTVGLLNRSTETRKIKIWSADVLAETHRDPGTILQARPEGIDVACGDQTLRILSLQREGGKRLETNQFLSGFPIHPETDRFQFPDSNPPQ